MTELSKIPDECKAAMLAARVVIDFGETYLHKYYSWKLIRPIGIHKNENNGKITFWVDYECADDMLNPKKWTKSDAIKLENFEDGEFVIRVDVKDIPSFFEQAETALKTGEISDFEDKSEDIKTDALVSNNKESVVAIEKNLKEGQRKVALVRASMEMLIEEKTRTLQNIKSKMESALAVFKIKIKKVMRVVNVLELYLGIEEELFQLQSGPSCDINEPISLRQQLLYMDEEVGDPKNGGIDFMSVPVFDEWLLKNRNFEKLIPEKKGVVAIRPRRHQKFYTADPWVNIQINIENESTYFLIRNGENIYRIFTENIHVHDRLFPLRNQLQGIMEELAKFQDKDLNSWDAKQIDEHESKMHQYQQRAFFLQGLLDRTTVFDPKPSGLSVFKMEDETIRFIYDDEAALPIGKKPFKEWHKELNSKIKKGSRLFLLKPFCGDGSYVSMRDYTDRLFQYYDNDYNLPPLPKPGIYEVFQKEWEGENVLFITYNPKDEIYVRYEGYRERKKGFGFMIDPSDEWLFNYDELSLQDIEFYLSSRTDRKNYGMMMPVLMGLKKMRLEEIEWENSFIDMIVSEAIRSGIKMKSEEEFRQRCWNLIEWWKTKNSIKRCITKDDTLALRMIKRKLLKDKS